MIWKLIAAITCLILCPFPVIWALIMTGCIAALWIQHTR